MPVQSRYPRPWVWPGNANIAMSIGFAFEAFRYHSQYSHSAEKGKVDLFSLSYADYGWKSGVWRLLDLLDDVGLKASMSTNGLAAERHPEAVRTAAEAGHEWRDGQRSFPRSANASRTRGGTRAYGMLASATLRNGRWNERVNKRGSRERILCVSDRS